MSSSPGSYALASVTSPGGAYSAECTKLSSNKIARSCSHATRSSPTVNAHTPSVRPTTSPTIAAATRSDARAVASRHLRKRFRRSGFGAGTRIPTLTRNRALHGPQCGRITVPGVSRLRYALPNAHPPGFTLSSSSSPPPPPPVAPSVEPVPVEPVPVEPVPVEPVPFVPVPPPKHPCLRASTTPAVTGNAAQFRASRTPLRHKYTADHSPPRRTAGSKASNESSSPLLARAKTADRNSTRIAGAAVSSAATSPATASQRGWQAHRAPTTRRHPPRPQPYPPRRCMGAAGRFGSLKMVGDCKSPARRAWSFARVSAPVWRARVTTAGLTAAAKVWSSRISARRRSPLRAMAASCAEGTQRRHLGSEQGFTTSSPPAPAASTSRFRAVARARARASTMALARIRRRIQFHVIQLTIARLAQPLAVVGRRVSTHPSGSEE